MSDAYSIPSFFSDDPRTGALTYDQLQARRKIALALATRNRPYPKTIGEGLTALGEGLGEGFANNQLARAEAAQMQRDSAATRSLTGARPAAGGASLEGDPDAAVADATENKQPLTPAQASQQPEMPIEEWKQRIARNESGLRKDAYTLVGERSRRGDYPYGKYQVMGENVPVWTAKYLGKEMTPQEFLADKDAQEQVARGRGSEYLAKYGPEGAAAAWFAGEKGMNDPNRKDTLGTHVAEYRRRFNIPLVSRDQVVASAARSPNAMAFAPGGEPDLENTAPVQVASLTGGMPTPDTAPPPAREAVAQSLVGPPPQQVAQAGGLPQPPQQQIPAVTPQAIPPAPTQAARPLDPGPEPKLRDFIEGNPQLKQQMDNARRTALDQTVSPHIQAQADAIYKELEKRANDAHTRQWTIWHERTKLQEADRLNADKRDIETQAARGKAYDEAEHRVLKYRFGGLDPGEGFKKLDKEQVTADLANTVMDDNRTILKAVRDGVIMGTGAGWRVQANKLAAWALQNGYASEQAANTEILRAMGGSRIRERLAQVNPVGVASNTDLLLARQLSGAEATMEPKSFMALLHKSNLHNSRLINDYEDKIDYTLGGTRAQRQYQLFPNPTAPQTETDKMLANRDDKALRAAYDDRYGEGSSALEIERFKRRNRGQ
jgi:hypothetical protein